MVITQETQFNVPVSAALMKRIGKGNVVLKEEVLVEEAELSQGDQVVRMIARHLRGQEGWVVLDKLVEL